jgi:hypothetical protein
MDDDTRTGCGSIWGYGRQVNIRYDREWWALAFRAKDLHRFTCGFSWVLSDQRIALDPTILGKK